MEESLFLHESGMMPCPLPLPPQALPPQALPLNIHERVRVLSVLECYNTSVNIECSAAPLSR